MSTPITDASIPKLLSTEITGDELIPLDSGDGSEAQAVPMLNLKKYMLEVGVGMYDAKRFGMRASNSPAQNKTAMSDAIAAVYAAGGGTIILPPERIEIDGNINFNVSELDSLPRGGIKIRGAIPNLQFLANCQDLWNQQTAGTRLVGGGIGSGALFVGQKHTGDTTNPFEGTAVLPAEDTDGLGMLDIGYFAVQHFDTIIDVGNTNANGLAFSTVSNIHAQHIHDWLFKMTNNQHVVVDRIHAWNISRGMWLRSANSRCAPGLTTIRNCYMLLRGLSDGGSYGSGAQESLNQADAADQKRYHFYLTNDSVYEANPDATTYQLDGIKIRDCQLQAYVNSGTMTDTCNVKVVGQAGGMAVNNVDIRDTNFDGAANYCVDGAYTNNLNVEIKHHPAILGDSTVKLRNSVRAKIESWNNNVTLDIDGTCTPFFVEGIIKGYVPGSRLGFGNHTIADSNIQVLGGGVDNRQGMIFDPANNTFGVSLRNIGSPNVLNSNTWPAVITKGTHRTSAGTTCGTDRAGVWIVAGTSNVTFNLPAPASMGTTIITTGSYPGGIGATQLECSNKVPNVGDRIGIAVSGGTQWHTILGKTPDIPTVGKCVITISGTLAVAATNGGTLVRDIPNGLEYQFVKQLDGGIPTLQAAAGTTIFDFVSTSYAMGTTKGSMVSIVFDYNTRCWVVIGRI